MTDNMTIKEIREWASDKYNATLSKMAQQLIATMRENERLWNLIESAFAEGMESSMLHEKAWDKSDTKKLFEQNPNKQSDVIVLGADGVYKPDPEIMDWLTSSKTSEDK